MCVRNAGVYDQSESSFRATGFFRAAADGIEVSERARGRGGRENVLRRVARFFAMAFRPSTRFSKSWSSAPWRRFSARIWCAISLSATCITHANGLETYVLELVELGVGLVRGLVRARLGEDLLEARVHGLLVQLVAVELEALDELLDGALGLEGEEGETERDVAPLARVVGESETLAELLHDVLGLFLLRAAMSG